MKEQAKQHQPTTIGRKTVTRTIKESVPAMIPLPKESRDEAIMKRLKKIGVI